MKLSKDGLEMVYAGKTKDVYNYRDGEILLYMKDGAGTRYSKEDSDGNEIGSTVTGMGQKNLIASEYYFKKFIEAGIPTHYLGCDIDENLMLVRAGKILGTGLECIIRFFAMGSLLRRFPDEYAHGQPVFDFFETILKSDADNDPPISKEELIAQGVVSDSQYDDIKRICQTAADVIQVDLKEESLSLVDLKFELGLVDGAIVLIDEVSAGVMRVARDNIKAANILSKEELSDILVTKAKRSKLIEMLLSNKDNCCI